MVSRRSQPPRETRTAGFASLSTASLRNDALPVFKARVLTLAIGCALSSLAGVAVLAPSPALAAESAGSIASQEYVIPAGRLSDVLARFAAIAGVQLVFDPQMLAGLNSSGLQGRYSVREGFSRLLTGSGYELVGAGSEGYSLRQLPASPSSNAAERMVRLPAVTVQSRLEVTAFDPVVGYVAHRSATATRTDTPLNEIPQSITVIGAQQIQDTGSQNLMDATRYTSGVTSDIFGSDNRADAIYIRGSKTPLLVDGLRSLLSQESYAHYEPFAYERIEVLRGSAGMIAGSNPPGGIVNLVSKRPLDSRKSEVFAQYGNHDHKKIRFDLSGPLTQERNLLYRLIATGLDSGSQTDWTKRENSYVKPMFEWRASQASRLMVYGEYIKNQMNTESNYSAPSLSRLSPPPLLVCYRT